MYYNRPDAGERMRVIDDEKQFIDPARASDHDEVLRLRRDQGVWWLCNWDVNDLAVVFDYPETHWGIR